ncbi:fibronectin, partial [Plakobranchus ocellatus]
MLLRHIWLEICVLFDAAKFTFELLLRIVVYDGENLRPVVGGYGAAPNECRGEYDLLFGLEGEYKFAINKIRCTPFSVFVKRRTELLADVTDQGFNPPIICLDQGHTVRWSWKACETPHTVNEVHYVMEKGCLRRQQGKNQNMVATVTGNHRQTFNRPGMHYFRTESSELGRWHLCIVCVRAAPREYKVEVLDRTFSPMILLIEEGDRVWWGWDRNKCQKLHHVYQIDAPPLDHKDDAPYEPTPDGFKWHHNPSKQGLMSHQFKEAGVYYFSDQNYDEAAEYIGTIIVKPKAREHQVELKGRGFNPEVLYAQTGDRVWWTWDGDAVASVKETLLVLEEDKVLNPISPKAQEQEDESLLQSLDEEGVQLMTRAGLATTGFTTIGVYTYKVSDVGDSFGAGSIIVNPGPKSHTIHLTDTGFEPKVVTIRPNDRVWWVWQSGKKQHNVVQVSHQGTPIPNGFCSGLPRDSPSAFYHQFRSPGVFYYISKSLPKVFGAVVVTTQPQVHEIAVGSSEIKPDPITIQMHDILCWVFKQAVSQGVTTVDTVDKILDAHLTNIPIAARRCIGQAVSKIGITHFHSRSFQKNGRQKSVTEETRLSSAVCDERSDYNFIKVNKRGFHPQEVYLQKGESVMWTWKGSDESHNIIHVTDPNSEAPLSVIQGAKSFNSGKLLENNCFLYTFDEPGDFAVASQGAPGFSCVIHIRDNIARTSEPYITSDAKGGTVERYYRIDLGCKTQGAEIYYTTDGSKPSLHLDATKHYYPDKGVRLKESGLCFVRAIAVKSGQVVSHPFTSKRFWVLSEGDRNEVSIDDNSNSQEIEPKQTTTWDWWGCRPHIKGCFTGPGLKINGENLSNLRYQVFLNGVSYCDMFPRSNNSLNISGLAGGRNYKIYVEVYPKDPQNVVQESNSLNLKCPIENEAGGPVISLVKTEKPDSLAIVWMAIDKPGLAIDGYLIYLNDQQCGPKLVPDPESNRCKVVIGSCDLNSDYRIYVQALIANSKQTRMSNVLEISLPLDVSHFRYPPLKDRLEEEDLYQEYVEVAEGAGYLKAMDDPDNLIWETETDTTSGTESDEEEEQEKSKNHIILLGKSEVKQEAVEREEIDPECLPLSQRKTVLKSFPTIESYSYEVLERQSRSTVDESSGNKLRTDEASKPRVSLPVAAKIVGRLSLFHKIVRASRAADMAATIPILSGDGLAVSTNEGNGSDLGEKRLPSQKPDWGNGRKNVKSAEGSGGRTAQFDMMAPPSIDGRGMDVQRRPSDTLAVPDANISRSSMSSSRAGLRVPDAGRRDSFDIHMRHMSGGADRHHFPGTRRDYDNYYDPPASFEERVYHFPGYVNNNLSAAGFYAEEDAYFDNNNYPDGYYYSGKHRSSGRSGRTSSRHSSRHSEYDGSTDRGERGRVKMFGSKGTGVGQHKNFDSPREHHSQQHLKQVRFQEYREFPLLNSDSSFSDGDEEVEHLYRAPSVSAKGRTSSHRGGINFTFGPAGEEIVGGYSRSSRMGQREEEYFDGFESDHSNYDNSREGSPVQGVNKKSGHTRVVKHRPPLPPSVPKLVTTLHDDDQREPSRWKKGAGPNSGPQYVLHEPYGNVPTYPNQPQPAPQPLPKERFGMLGRYLEYFGHPLEESESHQNVIDGLASQTACPKDKEDEDWDCQSLAAASYTDRYQTISMTVSESETETETGSGSTETESSEEDEPPQKPLPPAQPRPLVQAAPQAALLGSGSESDGEGSSGTESDDAAGRAGRRVLYLDAASNVASHDPHAPLSGRTPREDVQVEQAALLRGEPANRPAKSGLAIIEVQKTVALDKTGREVKETGDISEKTKLAVSTERMTMLRVGEGELVPGDDDGLLPSPSIMVESLDRFSALVGWQLSRDLDPNYKLQLFVVNVVGTKFSSKINSDISFECNLVEQGKQVRGVQHCWNIQPGVTECSVKGLHAGHTYRMYVIANYSMAKGNKPCEIQTTSSVLYYTTMGPPKSPTLKLTRVDAYQASLEWEAPAMENGLKVKGFQIYIDGHPLGSRRGADVRQMVVNNLVPGKTLRVHLVAVSEFADQESEPSRSVHITCPPRPPAPVISQQPSYKRGCVLMAWNKPGNLSISSNQEAITFYSIFIDGKWHGEVKANSLADKQGYQFYLTDLSSEQSYDVSVKAVAGDRQIDPYAAHIYSLSESPMSNIVPVMAPAAPKSPKLRLEGLHPDGIDVTWQCPQQHGDAYISGYQMLKNGKLYGSIIPADVNSLRIRDVTLGEKIELQLIALTEHPVGKQERKSEGDRDSGKGSSQHEEKIAGRSPGRSPRSAQQLITHSDYRAYDLPASLKDVFTGERYSGCKPGPKLVVHYTGLVCAPSEVWCEKVTGHSALIVWKKIGDAKAHFLRPDSYQVTWWPGDRAQEEIQSDSTTDDHFLITGLRPSTSYTIVVEARKMEKYTDFDEGVSVNETPDGLNAFILSSKSEQLQVKTASPPDPPSNVGVVALTCHSLKVGWDPPKEHGSEIIAIRVECLSLEPTDQHHVAVDTLPDAVTAEVQGLSEKTDYLLKVMAVTEEYFDRLPEKHRLKPLRGFPQDMLASREESPWLPSSSVLVKTSGTEPPCNVRVASATTTSLTLNWTPPLVHGSNKLTGQIVRWSDVKRSRRNGGFGDGVGAQGDEELQVASHVNLLATEDSLTIKDLLPGAQYRVVIEAVVSVKTSLEPDAWDGNSVEKFRRTAHVMGRAFYARTRAPIEPPRVLVTSYTQMSAGLYWEKPPLMSVVGKEQDGTPKYLRRYLQGYKLEINGKLQCCLGPESNLCTLTKCKPGRSYSVVLVAMTCTEEGRKARKHKSVDTKEIDYTALLQDDDNLDESPSDPVEVSLPKDQDGFLKTLEAKFEPQSSGVDNKTFGDISLSWSVQGKTSLVKQFNIVWYCLDDRVIQTKFVGPEMRRCTIPVTRVKTVYHMKVEPAYYTDVLAQNAQEVMIMVPGPPDSPEIFLRSVDIDEFCIEWGEPRLFGGVKVKGYQVYLNDKKAGNELNASYNKATIPCRPHRTYRVNVVALSDHPDHTDSHKSNTLVVCPSGPGQASDALADDSVVDDVGIPVTVSKVTENGIHLDWSRFSETEEVSFYRVQWSSVAQPEQREVKLSCKDSNCVINKCLPGTTHFVRIVACNVNNQILDKSRQLTIQTSAPPDAPKLSVRACNFRYIAIQWDKPTTYGDALVTGYKVYVNGIIEAVLAADQLSYTYTQGKWCHEYAFQVQALTAGDHLNSKPSEALVVTWPGSKAPAIKRLPSVSSSTLKVGWDQPYLTEGLKIKHYMLCCIEEGTEKMVQSIGPIHPDSREGEFKNLKKGSYSVYLEIH